MSVFSKIKMSRKAAKEHKGKEAAKAEPAVVVPYKHTPTHAAVDALSGAPSSWKIDDRSKIKAQHKRRSEMSRTGSYLSTVSYGTQNGVRYPQSDNGASSSSQAPAAPQMPPFPRNASYHSYNAGPAWFDKGDNLDRERYYQNEAPIQKRRKPTRGHSYHDSGLGTSVGPSPLASNIASEDVSPETTPVVSSGNSTNSNSSDHLEIATATRMTQNPNRQSQQQRPQPNIYADQDIFDRLHTNTTRKLGEAPISDSPPVFSKPTPTAAVAVEEQKQKKQRWSLRGKRNSATLAAM